MCNANSVKESAIIMGSILAWFSNQDGAMFLPKSFWKLLKEVLIFYFFHVSELHSNLRCNLSYLSSEAQRMSNYILLLTAIHLTTSFILKRKDVIRSQNYFIYNNVRFYIMIQVTHPPIYCVLHNPYANSSAVHSSRIYFCSSRELHILFSFPPQMDSQINLEESISKIIVSNEQTWQFW